MRDKSFGKWMANDYELMDLDPKKARDLMVECFYRAQHYTFQQQRQSLGVNTSDEFVRRSVVGAIRTAMREAGGDYDMPDRATLEAAVEILARRAATWGTPEDVIDHHRKQYSRVLARLDA